VTGPLPTHLHYKRGDAPHMDILGGVSIRPDGCWGHTLKPNRKGYVYMDLRGSRKHWLAHRVMYEWIVGPIPKGLVIDHLCRNRGCLNPSHMQPVTIGENVLRGHGASAENSRKTNCLRGHPYDAQNTYVDRAGKRHCRTCNRERQRKS